MSVFEYIWMDGATPTAKLRSKTRILPQGEEPPVWSFDGSSTGQARADMSDCVLQPVFTCPDPMRGKNNKLVLCEVLNTDMTPHESNTRRGCADVAERCSDLDVWFGIEQEYTLYDGIKPLGWPDNGFPAPQGGYYCGVGADEVYGRLIVEAHMQACLNAGILIAGINAEVMPAQWEFQVGPIGAPAIADQLWVARWLLYRIAEQHKGTNGRGISATLNPKPVAGDWNGAGAHTNYSTAEMRGSYDACVAAAEALEARHDLHVSNYGEGIDRRLTGHHETSHYKEFTTGDSDRGASVRIPWHVKVNKGGYIEDRRPNANVDPYVLTRLILGSVCETQGI